MPEIDVCIGVYGQLKYRVWSSSSINVCKTESQGRVHNPHSAILNGERVLLEAET